MQFIQAYDIVAADPVQRAKMQTASLKGEWSKFSAVAVDEMSAATSDLLARGVELVGDGRQQAAELLERQRRNLGYTMPKFFKYIADRKAANNEKKKLSTDV